MVSVMPALRFQHLRPQDRVAVKPHASPVLHAINYLLGGLDARYLTTLREFGGLQSYPSRTKDPDPADYSTGSVGIGAAAPVWVALARRYARVTVLDGHPHTLAFLAGVQGVLAAHLGVSRFGQSGDLASVYRHHRIDEPAIVCAALDLVD